METASTAKILPMHGFGGKTDRAFIYDFRRIKALERHLVRAGRMAGIHYDIIGPAHIGGGDRLSIAPDGLRIQKEGENALVIREFPPGGQGGGVIERERIHVQQRLVHHPEQFGAERVIGQIVVEAGRVLPGIAGQAPARNGVRAGYRIRLRFPAGGWKPGLGQGGGYKQHR